MKSPTESSQRSKGRADGRGGGRGGAYGYDLQDRYVASQLAMLLVPGKNRLIEVLWEKKSLEFDEDTGPIAVHVDDVILHLKDGKCVFVQVKAARSSRGWSANRLIRSGVAQQFWKQWNSLPREKRSSIELRLAACGDVENLRSIAEAAKRSSTPAELLNGEASVKIKKEIKILADHLNVGSIDTNFLSFLRCIDAELLPAASNLEDITIQSLARFGESASHLELLLVKLVAKSKHPDRNARAGFSRGTLITALLGEGFPRESLTMVGVNSSSLPTPEPSALLKEKKMQARVASRRHDFDSAVSLWKSVQEQAAKERNKTEEICARLEIILTTAQNERNPKKALKLADECLQEAQNVDLGDERCRLLQLVGELHRLNDDHDQAKGYMENALEHARGIGSHGVEGFALLSLSLLKRDRKSENNDEVLELITLAYNAFSKLYASGDQEKKRQAKDGFAQCHFLKADLFDYDFSDEALTEWTRALKLFQELGEDWEWYVAETFLRRADLGSRLNERKSAADDLKNALEIFSRIGNTAGVAQCHLKAGEFLDAFGRREEALKYYQQAAAIATAWKDDSRASYYYFRHACKLIELHKADEAEPILIFLANADWLEPEHKLTVVTQLCLLAHAHKKDEELKERSALALGLIDDLIQNAVSADARRRLVVQRGSLLEQIEQHEKAIDCFKSAITGFEKSGDRQGVIECWSHIRSVMQHLKDRRGEREAAEKIIALDAEKVSPMIAALTLVMLAQLNIEEQRFSEARDQIDRAMELDANNPFIGMIATDLRTKLPKFSLEGMRQRGKENGPPNNDLPDLLYELEKWCAQFPARRKSILAVWYYVRRVELWNNFRSKLGVKFMLCTKRLADFERGRVLLREHADFFVWATNFDIKPKPSKLESSIEAVPVPKGFNFPAGTIIINPALESADHRKSIQDRVCDSSLRQTMTDLPVEPYYLAFTKSVNEKPDVQAHFYGARQIWGDQKVVKFMLGRPAKEMIAENSICLPLNEGEKEPNLTRAMSIARETGAIPVFLGNLPYSDEIRCVCDSKCDLSVSQKKSDVKTIEVWEKLLSSCQESPKVALASFTRAMVALCNRETTEYFQIRIYMLGFRVRDVEVIYPAVVVQQAESLKN